MPTSKSVSSNFYLSFFKFLSGNILLDLILTMQMSYSISTLRFFFHELKLLGQHNFSLRQLSWEPNYVFANLRIITIVVTLEKREIITKHRKFSGISI